MTVSTETCRTAIWRAASDPCHQQIPDDHLAGCRVYPEADSPHRIELRPDGAGIADTDFLLYLQIKNTDKCRAEVQRQCRPLVAASAELLSVTSRRSPAPQANVLAYAVHCQTGNHGRPVAGAAVICKDRLAGATYSHQRTVQVNNNHSIKSFPPFLWCVDSVMLTFFSFTRL